jgi:DNA-binding response OmpR family regulator
LRILLVEDDMMLGKATVTGLKNAYAADWCRNAEDAEEALRTTDYDALVLDINLPGQSGLEFLKKLRGNRDDRPVLLLTARDAVHHRVEGLNAGADDYLVKPFDLDELLARVGALIRRSQGRGSSTITHGDMVFDLTRHTVARDGKTIMLSGREQAILDILLNNTGRVISKAQIEERIYDWSSEEIESNTIEVHVSALRRKLGKDLIKTIRGLGYIIPQ